MKNRSDIIERDILSLERIESLDLPRVGNKAFNLSVLLNAGLPVPGGVVLTIDFVSKYESMAKSDERFIAVREILDRFANECAFPLAVRSSAVGEDSSERSFAGIFRTRLNVRSLEELRNALDEVVAARHTDRVRAYAGHANRIELAVILQQCVEAECSGVAFTANPVDGNRNEMIIEYFNGVGEGIVGGHCTPQHLVWNRQAGRIVKSVDSHGGKATRFDNHAGSTYQEMVAPDAVYKLSPHMLSDLVGLAERIEDHFGVPQDVEWSLSGGKLYLLQSRPVTTL